MLSKHMIGLYNIVQFKGCDLLKQDQSSDDCELTELANSINGLHQEPFLYIGVV